MSLEASQLRQLLQELGDWLLVERLAKVDWLVCGGAALALQSLLARTTIDVDVLGRWEPQSLEVLEINAFETGVLECIRRVARAHPEVAITADRWINLGPAKLTRRGLPEGYASRLVVERFGPSLTLRLLGRPDLIALKLYAAADRHDRRQDVHLGDLRLLKPTFAELDVGLDWVRTMPDFELIQPEVRGALERLGYDDLAYYV